MNIAQNLRISVSIIATLKKKANMEYRNGQVLYGVSLYMAESALLLHFYLPHDHYLVASLPSLAGLASMELGCSTERSLPSATDAGLSGGTESSGALPVSGF